MLYRVFLRHKRSRVLSLTKNWFMVGTGGRNFFCMTVSFQKTKTATI